jgi:hypothetical protein
VAAATNGNGNGRHGLLAGVSDKLIRALPPAFLLLVLLNIVFLGVASYVFQHNTTARNEMIQRIIASCLEKRP